MEYTDGYVRAVERMYAEVPEIKSMFAVVAPGLERPNPVNFGVTFTQLAPWEEREPQDAADHRRRWRRS